MFALKRATNFTCAAVLIGCALAALSTVTGCSMAYRPGDKEFVKELKRVGDGMVEMKQREAAILKLKTNLLAQQRELLKEQKAARETMQTLIDTLLLQRCPNAALPQTYVPEDKPFVPQTQIPLSRTDFLLDHTTLSF